MELKLSLKKPNKELVKLVAQTVEDIASIKGYLTWPKEAEVELVLRALYLVNIAMEVADGTRGRRKRTGTKEPRNTPSINHQS